MTTSDRWLEFLRNLAAFKELTLVGPLAATRPKWPEPAIFVDGGNRHQTDSPMHFSVGDGDSAWRDVDFELPEEKDYSDFAFVLRSMPMHIERFSLVGFLGGRRDHELANLGEIHKFLVDRQLPTECNIDFSVCAYTKGHWPLDLKSIFSVMVMEPTRVRIQGECAYKINMPQLLTPFSSHGLSNEGWGIVEIEADRPFFVFKNPFT